MHIDTCHYWGCLLAALDEFVSGRISYDGYITLIDALRGGLPEDCRYFTSMTPFQCVPLGSAMLHALADVSPMESETEESLRDAARELYDLYYRAFVSHEMMYTQPAGSSVFGPDGIPVIGDPGCLPEPVRNLLDFSTGFLAAPEDLSPETTRQLHSIYSALMPDTVLCVLCIEALQALLPWLSEGIAMEDDLSIRETRDRSVDELGVESFRKWAHRLQGRSSFVVSLRYHRNNVLIRIDDWPPDRNSAA